MCTTVHTEPTKAQQNLQARARSKVLTNAIVYKLADLKSPLQQSYWNAYHCAAIIEQNGEKIKARYCNQRWCITCNRIRTAKLINGYASQLFDLKDPQFVTLSATNVKRDDLPDRLKQYNEYFTRIRKNLLKSYNTKLTGLRKVEVTYNPSRDDFHPHFHCIIDGKETAETVRRLWLNMWGNEASIKANDIRPADKNSLVELFKYVVKISAKGKNEISALDWIFQCLKGKRVTAAYQMVFISEDVNPEQGQRVDWKPPQREVFIFDNKACDWSSKRGERLSMYIMDEPTQRVYERILRGYIDLEDLPAQVEPPPNYYDPTYTNSITQTEREFFDSYYKKMNPERYTHPELKTLKVKQLDLFN